MILDSLYFPCISYCQLLSKSSSLVIEQYDYFRKMSFRNRCIISGSNGLISLTVPVEGGRNNRNVMKDVKICYTENWTLQHWKAIVCSYSKSPYFEYYGESVEQLIKKRHVFLIDKNLEILHWIVKTLKLSCTFEFSIQNSLFDLDNISDYRNKWLPNNYLEVSNSLPEYFQIFEEKLGFNVNLSILDLLFCEGQNAKYLLR